jgi:hypothetical protein
MAGGKTKRESRLAKRNDGVKQTTDHAKPQDVDESLSKVADRKDDCEKVEGTGVDELAEMRAMMTDMKRKLEEATEEIGRYKVRVVEEGGKGETKKLSAVSVAGVVSVANNSPAKAVPEEKNEKSSDEKAKRKGATKDLDLTPLQMNFLKTAIKKKLFSIIKFARNLDLRDKAVEVGRDYLMIKDHKIESYVRSVEKNIVSLTTNHRCALYRSFKAKFLSKLECATCGNLS